MYLVVFDREKDKAVTVFLEQRFFRIASDIQVADKPSAVDIRYVDVLVGGQLAIDSIVDIERVDCRGEIGGGHCG